MSSQRPNNSFKPKLLRSGNGVAEKACHAVTCATQFGLTQALGPMMKIYEWLDAEQSKRWVCEHIEALAAKLTRAGNSFRAVGLVNYRSPEAVVFVSQPLRESDLAAALAPELVLVQNGIGQVDRVACAVHPVTLRFAEHIGLGPNNSSKPTPLRGAA